MRILRDYTLDTPDKSFGRVKIESDPYGDIGSMAEMTMPVLRDE